MDDPIVKGIHMSSGEHVQFMRMAIEAAREGRCTPGGECVGAVLVRDGQAASVAFNEGEMQNDPTAPPKSWHPQALRKSEKPVS
jgi:tRNA(Arg) A34 adenosine deaminase TadA